MSLLTDEEIHAAPGYKEDRELFKFAHAIEAAVLSKLSKGVSVEPEFKWCSVLQALPEEHAYVMMCFGVNVVEGSYGAGLWLSLAYGEAQPDFWAYPPKPPHHKRNGAMYSSDQLNTAIAAARVQAIDECVEVTRAVLRDEKSELTYGACSEVQAALQTLKGLT